MLVFIRILRLTELLKIRKADVAVWEERVSFVMLGGSGHAYLVAFAGAHSGHSHSAIQQVSVSCRLDLLAFHRSSGLECTWGLMRASRLLG
jgi:hypothetical protein